jgi:hypothetical protein
VRREGRALGELVVVGFSGRGDKDIPTLIERLAPGDPA